MPCELINGRQLDISFLHVFGALCYPKNDHEDIGKLGTRGDIGFSLAALQSPVLSEYTASTPTNLSSQAVDIPNDSQDTDELEPQPQHAQQQDDQAPVQPKTIADNVSNTMLDGNTFVNPFATSSTNFAESSSHYVDLSNMHTFYQPYLMNISGLHITLWNN
nr:integrase, catalytic region, zinc finger, CCHC-type, peptidase aspartic, catalytic [Tanacetum cinerariifolium]GFB70315.1 integrase, catalytic region, zinc finger, CCHC-type, peptidase aspartic, catalytic [Tanacetum cinerariifolium]